MHKLMGKHIWLSFLLATALLLSLPATQTFAAPHRTLTWTGWSCQDLSTKPIPGGTMYSQGCANWDDSSFQWASGGNTSSHGGPSAYEIYTDATGYDRCSSTDPWTWRNYTSGYSYNANWNGAGMGIGYYFDCGQGAAHSYMVYSTHLWEVSYGNIAAQEDGSGYW